MIHRPAMYNTTLGQYSYQNGVDDTAAPIDLGGTYYSLKADGTTSGPITSITLRSAEGAILMKSLLGTPDLVAPSAPTGVIVE